MNEWHNADESSNAKSEALFLFSSGGLTLRFKPVVLDRFELGSHKKRFWKDSREKKANNCKKKRVENFGWNR